jgi:archaellum component FlaC
MLMCLALLAPAQAQVSGLSIETIPLSDSYRRLPVKIYWRESAECPAEFNQVLKKTLDTAIILLRKSIYRFMEENDGKYDELIGLRLEYVDNTDDAQIIISGKQLEEGVAGVTSLGVVDGKLVKAEINYDCEVVLRPMVPAFNVVLHELLHGLGLGHTEVAWDIMGPKDQPEPVIYVSNLDLEALYQLWFKGYGREVYDLGPGAQLRQIKPYVVELNELEGIYRDLQSKYGTLSGEVSAVKADVTKLKTSLTQVSSKVAEVSDKLGKVSSNLERQARILENVSQELATVERFMLNKSAETDYKFRVVAAILQETWLTLQDLQNATATQAGRIAAAERGIASLNLLFILVLCFMAAVLAAFIYLARRLAALESRVLGSESCLESGGESG